MTWSTIWPGPSMPWQTGILRALAVPIATARPISSGLPKIPSITGYIVKEGDELWNLAKYYGTTKEGIMDINHMESEQLKCGDKLLIFKENASIL